MERDKPLAKGDPRAGAARERERDGDTPLGTHPVGTAVGGAAGAVAAGAAVGSMAGPVGAVVGAAIGAAAGGMTGKLVADAIDPQLEAEYWRKNWSDRHYIDGGFTYDQDYGPAYMHGVNAFTQYPDRHFDDLENDLSSSWGEKRGQSRLDWDKARPATHDAWQRAYDITHNNLPPDADGDNR